MTSETEIPQTLAGPLLQSFFMEHLCNHKRLSPQTVKSYGEHFKPGARKSRALSN
jgi:hypothetical protein